ncbi:uncharacterized protein LOC125761562 [Anopheles funestus]|uniref:uncharacterized protein LOC125761562 n=1 Tax=Anopheles funestus TaxID=62324 RepID=UPI0020C5E420|nr:uncharacterized protein LOC125761562 [Anopheles funestus]XP_049278744.1 uncharacterized protein LOC125761562 [Anopheles funestus]
MRPIAKANLAIGRAAALAILVSLATVSAVPSSVLAGSKEANGHRDVTASPGQNQLTTDDASYGDDRSGPSNPQKRGVNPLLYRETELRNDFSGNSIPQNGVWEDVGVPLPGMPYPMELFDAPIEPGPLDRYGSQQQQQQRTYDVLQSLLNRPLSYNPLFVGRTVSGGYPVRMHGGASGNGGYGERKKRTLATAVNGKSHSRLMRLKRSSGKLSPAEVFSLLALMDARDPYRPLSDYIPDEQTNDVLAYAPNGMYPDVALPLALEQLLGAHGGTLPADGYAYDDAGEWMNGWTEPSVDYMGIPMADLDALGALNDGKNIGSMNGYMPQKRFMVSKKKRSVPQATPSNTGHQQGGTIQAAA